MYVKIKTNQVVTNSIMNVGNTTTWGCAANVPGTSTDFGTGAANTAAIIAANCSTTVTAAKLCNDYTITVNGTTYSDWYLPSSGELRKFYDNRIAIGNFGGAICETYVSSAQLPTLPDKYYRIYAHTSYPGQFSSATKSTINIYAGVRAVCSF